MKSLNDLYTKFCKPKCENYKQISNNITLVDNFFEDFDNARNFFINREKWECIPYQGYELPGYMSMFPNWIGKSLMEKYALDNKISDDIGVYDTVCNFRYNKKYTWSLSNSDYFPHIDSVQSHDTLQYICLINLNNIPVSTKFYTYKNQEYCSSEMIHEWNDYYKKLNDKILNFYNNKKITRDQVKSFLENQNLDTKLIRSIKYNPNQALIYSADLFHCPNVSQEFTENNLRSLLRISFNKKISKSRNINYF
jgi:hypothetical protein